MRKLCLLLSVVMAFVLSFAGQLAAVSITYTETALITGTCNDEDVINDPITISWTGDTDNVFCGQGGCTNPAGPGVVFVDVLHFGSGFLINPTSVFVNQADGNAGFVDDVLHTQIMMTINPGFATYDLRTPIQLSGPGLITPNAIFPTTGGDLAIFSVTDPTFTATGGVPEPSSLLLLGSGVLGGLGFLRRRFLP